MLDEALTGLDLSVQAQIANLLLDLQETHSLTYLLISHDLTLVGGMADTMAVMSERTDRRERSDTTDPSVRNMRKQDRC